MDKCEKHNKEKVYRYLGRGKSDTVCTECQREMNERYRRAFARMTNPKGAE